MPLFKKHLHVGVHCAFFLGRDAATPPAPLSFLRGFLARVSGEGFWQGFLAGALAGCCDVLLH